MRGYTLRCNSVEERPFERLPGASFSVVTFLSEIPDPFQSEQPSMAIYRFEAKVISRSGGRSSVAAASYQTGKCATSAAAYRAGAKLKDERTGQLYDYTRKKGVSGAEIMTPEGAPEWMKDRAILWNKVEQIERRKDSQLARDFILSLPHELTPEQRVDLTRAFVREQFTDRGYVADIAWHLPDQRDGLNFHAHVMVPMRKVGDDGFARTKERPPEGEHPAKAWKDELARLREAWADTANLHLGAAGLDIKVDHRSLEARGINREPEPKQGALATQIEQQGRESLAGRERRAVKARNSARERIKDGAKGGDARDAALVARGPRVDQRGDIRPEQGDEDKRNKQKAGGVGDGLKWTDRGGMEAQQDSALKAVRDTQPRSSKPPDEKPGSSGSSRPDAKTDARSERLAGLRRMIKPKQDGHNDKVPDHDNGRGGGGRGGRGGRSR